jgi:hypothetical protein
VPQRLPAAGAVELEIVDQVAVDRIESQRGVGQDREEGDDPGAQQELRGLVVDIDVDQREDRHDRCDLEHDRKREQAHLDKPRLGEQH